jgi:serine/threonine protein kinase, bacterial
MRRAGTAAWVVAAFACGGCSMTVGAHMPPGVPAPAGWAFGAQSDTSPLGRLLSGARPAQSSACSPSQRPFGRARAGASLGTLFVSPWGRPIEEFDASGDNPNPLGSLTYSGFNHPYGLSVGPDGTLYVANYNGNDVFAFPQGATSPSLKVTNEVIEPLDAAADDLGNLYVVDGRGGPVLVFPPGGSSASYTLSGLKYPTSLAFDASWNLYVVDQLYGRKSPPGAVVEFHPGAHSGKSIGLTRLDYPTGIAIDGAGDIIVTNLGNNTVTEYAPGATIPKRTITAGICDPVGVAVNAAKVIFVANYASAPNGTVTGYKPTAKRPFVTLTNSINTPAGVAVNPNWQP